MKTTASTIIIVLLFLAVIILPVALNPGKAMVESTCRESRQVVDGELEEKCGELQDSLGYEFICEDFSPEAYCWAERK